MIVFDSLFVDCDGFILLDTVVTCQLLKTNQAKVERNEIILESS